MVQWPGVQGEAQPANAELLLYGGAAFERCLDEFQEAAQCLTFPSGEDHVLPGFKAAAYAAHLTWVSSGHACMQLPCSHTQQHLVGPCWEHWEPSRCRVMRTTL